MTKRIKIADIIIPDLKWRRVINAGTAEELAASSREENNDDGTRNDNNQLASSGQGHKVKRRRKRMGSRLRIVADARRHIRRGNQKRSSCV